MQFPFLRNFHLFFVSRHLFLLILPALSFVDNLRLPCRASVCASREARRPRHHGEAQQGGVEVALPLARLRLQAPFSFGAFFPVACQRSLLHILTPSARCTTSLDGQWYTYAYTHSRSARTHCSYTSTDARASFFYYFLSPRLFCSRPVSDLLFSFSLFIPCTPAPTIFLLSGSYCMFDCTALLQSFSFSCCCAHYFGLLCPSLGNPWKLSRMSDLTSLSSTMLWT